MAWVAVGAMVVSAGVSIHSSNVQGAQQRKAMSQQQANLQFASTFNKELTQTEQLKADIGFAQDFNRRLEQYNDLRSTQLAAVAYQGRTMDSISRIQQADEKRWEYDNTVMEINNNINKYSIAINGLQQSLGMNNQISGLDLAKQASKSAQTWNNISTATNAAAAGASMYMQYNTKSTSTNTTPKT